MILYHASTSYHVLCCIVHKLAYHYDEEAVFMIVEHMLPKEELQVFVNQLKACSWFHEIITVPEGAFRMRHGKPLNMQSSESDIQEVIRNICMEVDKWYPTGFHQYKDIYVASDQWSVGVYLLHHKIPYHYFEDASGMLGDEARYLTIIKELNLSNYVMSNYLKGAGRSEIVVDKLCDMQNQPEGFHDERAIDFSIYQLVRGLSNQLIDSLLLLYGARQYKFNSQDKVIVFMSQFLRTLTIKNLKVQEQITTLLLDYFGPGYKIIIKPHPKDRWIDYGKLVPEAIVLDNTLPSELLPFVLEGNIQLVLTASSTSIGGMSHISQKTISFGTDIEVHYNRLHGMFVAAMLIHEVFRGQRIITRNLISSHLEHFLWRYNRAFHTKDYNQGVIYVDGGKYVVGETEDKEYLVNRKRDILVFLNHAECYEFLTYQELRKNNFIVIQILICNHYDRDKSIVKREKIKDIWVYCEPEEEREIILSMNGRKKLNYSGLEIEISSQEATHTMILNGKMKAMQYVLKQKENEEMDPVLNKIKEVIKQYQEEDITKRVLLEEEGVIYE